MSDLKDKQPAFPDPRRGAPSEFSNQNPEHWPTGMTIRQYAAIKAMQGLCANSVPGEHHSPNNLVREAIEYADALLKELDKRPSHREAIKKGRF